MPQAKHGATAIGPNHLVAGIQIHMLAKPRLKVNGQIVHTKAIQTQDGILPDGLTVAMQNLPTGTQTQHK